MAKPTSHDWKYATGTDEAIKGALLSLLAEKPLIDVTVSELARRAHVSRSTFYEHFANPAEVYDELIDDFSRDVSPLMQQVACSSELQHRSTPLCARLRHADEFAPVVREDRFLRSYLGKSVNMEQHDLFGILTNAGYTPGQAQALCSFQLAGCFAAAQGTPADDGEWDGIKAAIDRFILGGIAACLAAKSGPDGTRGES